MKVKNLIRLLSFLVIVLIINTLILVAFLEKDRQESCSEKTGKPCRVVETMVDREIREFSECNRDPECSPYGLPSS